MNHRFPRLAPAVALCLPLLTLSPGQAQQRRADPSDAQAPAPPLRYPSAFAGYKAWEDTQPGDWRSLNDKLNPQPAAGAHGAHAMPSAASAPAPGAPRPMQGHGAHTMHGGKP